MHLFVYKKLYEQISNIYDMCWKIETEAVFTKAEMNNEWSINFFFFKIVPLPFFKKLK